MSNPHAGVEVVIDLNQVKAALLSYHARQGAEIFGMEVDTDIEVGIQADGAPIQVTVQEVASDNIGHFSRILLRQSVRGSQYSRIYVLDWNTAQQIWLPRQAYWLVNDEQLNEGLFDFGTH